MNKKKIIKIKVDRRAGRIEASNELEEQYMMKTKVFKKYAVIALMVL